MTKRIPICCLAIAGGFTTPLYSATDNENVLVIVVDDLGKEMLSIYNTPNKIKAKTPNIDKLAKTGVVFDNVWGYPLSAPVRAAMLTGRYGHHTGIVALEITLPLSEETLFEALPEGYSNAVIGKWHLSKKIDFAAEYGIDHFAGIATEGGVRNYYKWLFTVDGESEMSSKYVTTQITDSAKEWIADQKSPWVCWVAYNAPHIPLHLPPSHMHSQKRLSGDADDIAQNSMSYYLAMIESLDYDIGRLLEGIDESTTVILVGDNGTERRLLPSPYSSSHGKGTLYESGVAIPMIISGGNIPSKASRCDALVSAVDLFPSIMELTGESMASYEDGYSFISAAMGGESQRQFNFSEILNRRLGYMNAVCDGQYKLITSKSGKEELYNIATDPLESRNLLQSKLSATEEEALKALKEELARMEIPIDSIPDTPPASDGHNPNRGFGGSGERGSGTTRSYGGSRGGNGGDNSNRVNNNQYRSNR
ncbi:MAG: sulfatase-like hydrolase/transferase [Rikenellaceae bacterium]